MKPCRSHRKRSTTRETTEERLSHSLFKVQHLALHIEHLLHLAPYGGQTRGDNKSEWMRGVGYGRRLGLVATKRARQKVGVQDSRLDRDPWDHQWGFLQGREGNRPILATKQHPKSCPTPISHFVLQVSTTSIITPHQLIATS